MHLLKVEAHNVKRVTDVSLDLAGHHLFVIGGKNGMGKTSCIDSIVYAVCGKKSIPGKPLRQGQQEGSVVLEITGDPDVPDQQRLKVTRHFTADGTTRVEVQNEDGYFAPRPQDLLNDLYGRIGFDPLEFTRMKPREQLDELKAVVGLDFDELDAEYKTVYETRRVANKEVKDTESRLKLLPKHPDAPKEEQDLSGVRAEIERITAENRKRDEIIARNEQGVRDRNRIQSDIGRVEDDIKRLEAELDARKAELARLTGDFNAAGVPEEVPEEVSMDAAFEKQAEIEAVNTQVRENKAWNDAKAELDAKIMRANGFTEKLKQLTAKKESEMAAATWPVEGLGFSDGGVTLNGLPFEQASSAEQLRVAVAMGMSANPKLKVLIIRDGSLLDDDSMKALEKIVREHKYQLLVEVVTRTDDDEGRCQVVIENGQVKPQAAV